jgi:hypothetical protein
MSYEPPMPPAELPADLVNPLNESSSDTGGRTQIKPTREWSAGRAVERRAPPASCIYSFVRQYEQLQHVARYAEELAEHKAREARLEEDSDENEIEERPDDLPDNVSAEATITIKEINDNRYYYWQWREGDKIRSQYKGSVKPDE